jgi:hypothetical protein
MNRPTELEAYDAHLESRIRKEKICLHALQKYLYILAYVTYETELGHQLMVALPLYPQ